MSDITNAQPGKNYAIMRVERISSLSEMRRIEQHNTREKLSENVEEGGPPPRELLPEAHYDTVVGARERMVELELDLGKVAGAVGVEMILTTSPGWWDTATQQMKQDWVTANVVYLREKFGRALLSAKLHEDEKTPHIHAVALAAVSKVDGVRGPKPKSEEGKERRRQEQAKRTARWRWNYRDLFGQDFEHLSREQDRYHVAVAHLRLERGERDRANTDVVLENGVVVPAAQLSRGRRRDGSDRPRRRITTKQNQALARADRISAAEEIRLTSEARAVAETAAREAEQLREAAAIATKQAERERAAAETELADVRRVGEEAARTRAEAVRALADADVQRNRLDAERRLRDQQFELLVRGTDEDSGLDLRATDKAFSMRRDAMRPTERPTYDATWSDSLIRLGRQLAQLLEKARKLLAREKNVEAREAAVARKAQEDARDRAVREQEHADALAAIQRRERHIGALEDAAATRLADADIKAAAASAKEAEATATLVRYNRWAMAVDAIIEQPDGVDIIENRIRIDPDSAIAADRRVVAVQRDTPPTWAFTVLCTCLDLADRERETSARERSVARSSDELGALLARASRELSPDQQKLAASVKDAVRRADSAARAWKNEDGGR